MIPAKYWSPTKKLMVLGAMAGGKAVEDTVTGNPLTFLTDLARPLKSLLIPFTPQQEGTGDPSPSNIRSILPWNGLTVFGGGKNLLNPANRVASGNNVQYYRSGNRFLLKGGQTYTLSANVIPAQTTMYKGTNTTVASTTSASLTYTPTENVEVWFDFYVPNARLPEGGISAVYGMLEVGATATAYEPYKPITDTDIVFTSPVYGGTLDVVSGVLTVEYGILIKNTASMNGYLEDMAGWVEGAGIKALVGEGVSSSTYDIVCDKVKKASINTVDWRDNLYLPQTLNGLTQSEWKELATDVMFVVRLATPTEQTLTGHQITALIGNNTIWSDADGQMTAVYLKKG